MSSKFLNVVLAVLLSTCVLSQAKATLIVGEIYEDTLTAGVQWEYIGRFDLVASAPHWSVATPYNGLEAAALLSGLPMNELALAAFILGFDITTINVGDAVVNHLAWYDGDIAAISRLAENVDADINDNGTYDVTGDVSAYVDDRGFTGDYFNYVFRAVAVPEPSTLAIFALALFGLSMRRLKKA